MITRTKLEEQSVLERKRESTKLVKLKRASAVERKRLDEKIARVMFEQEPETHARLVREATDAPADDKATRLNRARRSAQPTRDIRERYAPRDDMEYKEVKASWL